MNEDVFHLGVKALIRNERGDILLLKINPKELKNFKGEAYWDIPGGRIQRGSTVEDTLKREIKEETGVDVEGSIIPITMVLSNIRIPDGDSDVGLILSIYKCKINPNQSLILSDEHTEAKWFDKKEAAKLLDVKYPKDFTKAISND